MFEFLSEFSTSSSLKPISTRILNGELDAIISLVSLRLFLAQSDSSRKREIDDSVFTLNPSF